jgi:hypothetical protein
MQKIIDKLNFIFSAIEQLICGKTEEQIIIATLNGECKGEPLNGQKAVRNVIANRANGPSYFRRKNPIYSGSNKEVLACLSKYQFSVWNSLTSCANFNSIYNNAMQGATITSIPEVDYSVFTNGTGLTLDQAKKIYLFCNPDAKASRNNNEEWVKIVVKQSDANPKKSSWTAEVLINGQKVKATFIRIGNHVFVHGIQ